MQKIAVVGAGRMGTGIAQVFAYAGHPVSLLDLKKRPCKEAEACLGKAKEDISASLALLADLGITNRSVNEHIVNRISCYDQSQAREALQDAVVVFEAVPEVLTVKEEAMIVISEYVSDKAIIASTTSTFLVDTLAGFVKKPVRFLNTHWLNPAHLIPLVEVSPAEGTGDLVLDEMLKLLGAVGKIPVKCAPSPGFIVPRIQALAMNEAARLVEEGVAEPKDIDKACRVGFGLRFAVLGLLEFIDWGGGDILYYADNYLTKELKAERFTAPDIINENMKKGNIGLKTGSGFYDYRGTDLSEYQRETLAKFVDLLMHLGLLIRPKD